MEQQTANILIGGEAGQGLATMGRLLCKIFVRAGFEVLASQTLQSRIRGGHNTVSIRVSTESVRSPSDEIDILVALDDGTVDIHKDALRPNAIVIQDAQNEDSDSSLWAVPLKDLAEGGYPSTVALGVVASVAGVSEGTAQDAISELFSQADQTVIDTNVSSLKAGYRWVAENSRDHPDMPAPGASKERLILTGNESIALGAFSAGLKFYAFYPMSPSTSIAETIVQHAKEMGVVVEQVEDEIAALNMAIGASYAGARSMVGTSGGGLALMSEAVSLAGATETPVVVVIAQRPGPATGLPTRTEQGDLDLVLNVGHGEFPRAVFAPADVHECFHLTRTALDIADRAQTPVFILTDQYLADSFHSVRPFDIDDLSPIDRCLAEDVKDDQYLRYKLTDSGVSPRLIPGLTIRLCPGADKEHLVIADSHEHTEDGHVSEDATVRVAMVEKRLRKLSVIKEAGIPPDVTGDENPDLMLVCWGTTKGAVLEAADRLRDNDRSVGVAHLQQVWPLPEGLADILSNAAECMCIEGNATGQLASLIRQETGVGLPNRILRYDGHQITPEYIIRAVSGK
jgi:2-oxoglutarate ferredoxin oxidoreductase subunit alpha